MEEGPLGEKDTSGKKNKTFFSRKSASSREMVKVEPIFRERKILFRRNGGEAEKIPSLCKKKVAGKATVLRVNRRGGGVPLKGRKSRRGKGSQMSGKRVRCREWKKCVNTEGGGGPIAQKWSTVVGKKRKKRKTSQEEKHGSLNSRGKKSGRGGSRV